MDAQITNIGTAAIFLPGPKVEVPVGGTVTWAGVTLGDLDGSPVLKQAVVDGKLSVTVTDDTFDVATAVQGSLSASGLSKYALADLPTGYEGRVAFVTDGRKTAEGAAAGTGVPAYYSNAQWRVFFDDSVVVA